jgi:hypothetical protein
MESNGKTRGGLLTAGGVLSIIGGALEIISGGMMVAVVMHNIMRGPLEPFPPIPFVPGGVIGVIFLPRIFIFVGIALLVLGIVALAGGVSALTRRSYGLSLAGAICALPSIIFGILAVIFVPVSKKEFEA